MFPPIVQSARNDIKFDEVLPTALSGTVQYNSLCYNGALSGGVVQQCTVQCSSALNSTAVHCKAYQCTVQCNSALYSAAVHCTA